MRNLWLIVDDYDTPDAYPWEVVDPEPYEVLDLVDDAPDGYVGRHIAMTPDGDAIWA